MEDTTETGRTNPTDRGKQQGGRKCSDTGTDTATANFSLGECRTGQRSGWPFTLGENTSVPKPVVRR